MSRDVDSSIGLSDILRTGENSRLRRRGAIRLDPPIVSSAHGSYVLFCGNPSTTSSSMSPFEPSLFPVASSSAVKLVPEKTEKSSGCGAVIHMHALPVGHAWSAQGPSSDAVAPLDVEYFEEKEKLSAETSAHPCGCFRQGIGCKACGNPLGNRTVLCQSHGSSSRRRNRARSASPPPRGPTGPRYWRHTSSSTTPKPSVAHIFYENRVTSSPEHPFTRPSSTTPPAADPPTFRRLSRFPSRRHATPPSPPIPTLLDGPSRWTGIRGLMSASPEPPAPRRLDWEPLDDDTSLMETFDSGLDSTFMPNPYTTLFASRPSREALFLPEPESDQENDVGPSRGPRPFESRWHTGRTPPRRTVTERGHGRERTLGLPPRVPLTVRELEDLAAGEDDEYEVIIPFQGLDDVHSAPPRGHGLEDAGPLRATSWSWAADLDDSDFGRRS